MIEFQADFYNGATSLRTEATVTFDDTGTIRVDTGATTLRHPFDAVRIGPRIGNTPRSIHLPHGAKLETTDNDAVDRALGITNAQEGNRVLHRLESRLRYAIAALALTLACGWGFIEYAIPALAAHVAQVVPADIETTLGEQGLAALDQAVLEPSTLSRTDRQRLRALYRRLRVDTVLPSSARLEFRTGAELGANAFALPAGIVVLTDELVSLSGDDGEVVAVLAHELGHVEHRHIMRQLLQGSMTALLIAAAVGDLSSIAGFSAALPTFLLEQRYSRRFELEADAYAAHRLDRIGVAREKLIDILAKLEAAAGGDGPGYLSTHPTSAERAAAILKK